MKEIRGNTIVAAPPPPIGAVCLPFIMVDSGCGPLGTLLAPLLAVLSALLVTVDGHVRQCLLATAWGRLLGSLGGTMFGRLITGGV
jgi:hypothetical protein